jgi:type IV pilus assembly protein PilV
LRSCAQRGASLLEVLVSIVILAIGLLSMAWLHSVSLQYDKMSQFRGVATQLASDLADRIRANVGAATNYVFVDAYAPGTVATAPVDCVASVCAGPEVALFDVAEFRNAARLNLPDGSLFVTQDAANPRALTIWVMWRDPEAVDTAIATASLAAHCPAAIGTPVPMPQCMPLRVLL